MKLLYFGMLKDLVGETNEDADLPDGSTVGELLRVLRNRTSKESTSNGVAGNEMTEQVWRSLAVAVNREYAVASAVLREGDEVALLPPVSGGAMVSALCDGTLNGGMSQGLKPSGFRGVGCP